MEKEEAIAIIHKIKSGESVPSELYHEAIKMAIESLESDKEWKRQMIEVWAEVDEYARNHPEIKLGQSVSFHALKLMKERDKLIEQREKPKEGISVEDIKPPEFFLKRGTGNFIHCTDYEDAIQAAHEYHNQFPSVKQSPYPKMMMVWDDEVDVPVSRFVIAEFNNEYIAIDRVDYSGIAIAWLHAKDI
jgi:hypothetical protein